MLGRLESSGIVVQQVKATVNCWGEADDPLFSLPTSSKDEMPDKGSKLNRFAIPPQTLFVEQKASRAKGLAIVGIYHSHPNAAPVPSEFDLAIAWPEYIYWIMSLQPGQVTPHQAWQLDDKGKFNAIQILIADA